MTQIFWDVFRLQLSNKVKDLRSTLKHFWSKAHILACTVGTTSTSHRGVEGSTWKGWEGWTATGGEGFNSSNSVVGGFRSFLGCLGCGMWFWKGCISFKIPSNFGVGGVLPGIVEDSGGIDTSPGRSLGKRSEIWTNHCELRSLERPFPGGIGSSWSSYWLVTGSHWCRGAGMACGTVGSLGYVCHVATDSASSPYRTKAALAWRAHLGTGGRNVAPHRSPWLRGGACTTFGTIAFQKSRVILAASGYTSYTGNCWNARKHRKPETWGDHEKWLCCTATVCRKAADFSASLLNQGWWIGHWPCGRAAGCCCHPSLWSKTHPMVFYIARTSRISWNPWKRSWGNQPSIGNMAIPSPSNFRFSCDFSIEVPFYRGGFKSFNSFSSSCFGVAHSRVGTPTPDDIILNRIPGFLRICSDVPSTTLRWHGSRAAEKSLAYLVRDRWAQQGLPGSVCRMPSKVWGHYGCSGLVGGHPAGVWSIQSINIGDQYIPIYGRY